jgi:hypothetical protein
VKRVEINGRVRNAALFKSVDAAPGYRVRIDFAG